MGVTSRAVTGYPSGATVFAWFLGEFVLFWRSLFDFFVVFLLAIVMYVLHRITTSDYLFTSCDVWKFIINIASDGILPRSNQMHNMP